MKESEEDRELKQIDARMGLLGVAFSAGVQSAECHHADLTTLVLVRNALARVLDRINREIAAKADQPLRRSPEMSEPSEPTTPRTWEGIDVEPADVLPVRAIGRLQCDPLRRFLLRNLRAVREAAAAHEADFVHEGENEKDRQAAVELRAQADVLSDLLLLLFHPDAVPLAEPVSPGT